MITITFIFWTLRFDISVDNWMNFLLIVFFFQLISVTLSEIHFLNILKYQIYLWEFSEGNFIKNEFKKEKIWYVLMWIFSLMFSDIGHIFIICTIHIKMKNYGLQIHCYYLLCPLIKKALLRNWFYSECSCMILLLKKAFQKSIMHFHTAENAQ